MKIKSKLNYNKKGNKSSKNVKKSSTFSKPKPKALKNVTKTKASFKKTEKPKFNKNNKLSPSKAEDSFTKSKTKKKTIVPKKETASDDSQWETENTDNLFDKTVKLKMEEDSKDSHSESENSDNYDEEFSSHKESLANLRNTDPEFYEFLKQNDKKLLDFNVSDSDEEKTEEEEEKTEKEETAASDESDFEVKDEVSKISKTSDPRKITLSKLKEWQANLATDKTSHTITCVIKAFHAALLRVANDEDQQNYEYVVDGSAIFNGVIQLCVLDLQPALRKFLKLPTGSKLPPHKCKRFVKIKTALKLYLADLTKLVGGVTSPSILTILLKHLHHICPMVISYAKIAKSMLRKLINLWGTGDETLRVLAFLCILRITNCQRATYLDFVLKKMYMTYVINAKFVSPNTLPAINFMRRSLVEMYSLDVKFSYQHVFLYVRQLAIHLRNAITVHKKESIQTVYNWQFVNSLQLWTELIAATHNEAPLQPLLYPVVQVCTETIKLIPTAQYFPLRFHCIKMLINLAAETGVFIPILPFLYEIFDKFDFNKKHKKVSMKPMQFTCVLRLSKSQLTDNTFKDAVIERIYSLVLEFLASQSHSIAFPDLVVPLIFEMKEFLKKCKIANYCKKMKQLLAKIEENFKFIDEKRRKLTLSFSDKKAITVFENSMKNEGTPINKFYETWKKLHDSQKAIKTAAYGDGPELPVPNVRRNKKTKNAPENSDSSDDEDENEEKQKRPKKRNKQLKSKKNVASTSKFNVSFHDDNDADTEDIVQNLNIKDW